MPCICGSDLVVVARLRAAAVPRLSWGWPAFTSGSVKVISSTPPFGSTAGMRQHHAGVVCAGEGATLRRCQGTTKPWHSLVQLSDEDGRITDDRSTTSGIR